MMQFRVIPAEGCCFPAPSSPSSSSQCPLRCRSSSPTVSSKSLLPALILLLICCCFSTATSADENRCMSCEQRSFEEYKKVRQDQILKDLLKKLELSAKPNVTVDYDSLRYIAPRNPRIQALIEESRRGEQQHKRVRKVGIGGTQMSIKDHGQGDYFPSLYETVQDQPAQTSYFLAQGPPDWLDQELPTALFKFSADLRKKFVLSARLNVFLHRPEQFGFGPLSTRLIVYQRFPNGTLGPRLISKHLELNFDETTVYEQVEMVLDTQLIQTWIETGLQFDPPQEEEDDGDDQQLLVIPDERSPSTVGFYVEALYEGENLVQYPAGVDSAETTVDALMFFELELVNLKTGRSRRNVNTCRPGSNHTKCCLYDLVIDFEKIGWNFVIAPKRYNAYVCSGECVGFNSAPQMGRAAAALSAKIDHFQCCHPKEYSGIMILYMNDNNAVNMRELPNMVARDCGCT